MTKDLRIELIKAYTELLFARDCLRSAVEILESFQKLEIDDSKQTLTALFVVLNSWARETKKRGLPRELRNADRLLLKFVTDEQDEDRLARRLRGVRNGLHAVAPPLCALG